MYLGSEFQMEEAAAGKARLPTVESMTDGTMRRLVAALLLMMTLISH